MKARSELVTPTNFAEGGVVETRRRFQAATPASNLPARRPTRGSGLGGATAMLGAGVESVPAVAEQAASASTPASRMQYVEIRFIGVTPWQRASVPFARSRWFDRRTRRKQIGKPLRPE